MSQGALIEEIESSQLKTDIPEFCVGDTVKVHIRIIEGEKERIQVFTGTVIARKGSGFSETFSVYRIAYGVTMERVFILHSPRIAKIEVIRKGKVRQAKLYYLRGVSGKKAKVKEKIGSKKKKMVIEDEAYAAPLQEENPAEVKEAAPKAEKKKAAKPKKEEKSASEETPPEESKE
ncbi:50S ribosomal protein L19 [Simkania negevensis Z]|uniref:Large ribosomal subunit protein bL19 n=1 Tax=Simkania negevensis (strain ATCC VR-1471 / DSM 27360 / Z) TaxID=331113 RepID=F8L7B4_SIMNZ|nr:50S ribosomal protein L19 [Simkania sp.]CCB88637.1 50S ribosomal protein L19 [Simkania negevensis Z]